MNKHHRLQARKRLNAALLEKLSRTDTPADHLVNRLIPINKRKTSAQHQKESGLAKAMFTDEFI